VRSAGFDFARAASLLTDAASRAGAAIMAHFHTCLLYTSDAADE